MALANLILNLLQLGASLAALFLMALPLFL